jgi:hypothetical protein
MPADRSDTPPAVDRPIPSSPPAQDAASVAPQERDAGLRGRLRRVGLAALEKASGATSYIADETLRAARVGVYATSHTLQGQVLPAFSSLEEMRRDIERSWLATLSGEKAMADCSRELGERFASGNRYRALVEDLGRQLFGSAVYPGEQVLADDGVFRLSHLPAKDGAPETGVALFFVGSFMPYGDRLFRFLPEASYYQRYLERGIPVYTMEIAGDCREIKGLGKVTLERQIDCIDRMAEIALRHNGGRRMVAQGYCGSGMELMAYLAARPRDAEAKFKLATTFVTPLDARRCKILSDMVSNVPRSLVWTTLQRSRLMGGYLQGLELWAGLDTSLDNVFTKTPMGRFASGWKKPAFARVQAISDLDPLQRFELAGAYWISLANAERWPIPVEQVRLAFRLYDKGVSEADGGYLGFGYRGTPVRIAAIAEQSRLRVTSIFGGQDKLVPEECGLVLGRLLGSRYRQITHPTAAHVSYVCFPAQWDRAHPHAFLPNPVDVILEDYARAE